VTVDEKIATPEAKREYVRRLFATIANRYDLITVVLSYGLDRRWKERLVRIGRPRRGMRALDLATGTGDIAFGLAACGADVVALDITPRMIELARAKAGSRRVRFLVGDMLALPFRNSSFDIVTVGYGLRNVPDLDAALAELARVVRPGGQLLSLDFNRPRGSLLRTVYFAYLRIVGGGLGWLLHGDPDTYRYIPASLRTYPGAGAITHLMQARGFDRVAHMPLLFGLMSIHDARKA
jgi:ubiquinone/menaquinone biosynthesis methyltransferase